jgi:hypothetical protein
MKIALVAGWVLLAIEGVLVVSMFVQPNVGDDAAGRGMARGFALVLTPILIGSAALFIWGQRGGPRGAFWAGFGIMAVPLALIVFNRLSSTVGDVDRAHSKAQYGKFDDARLTRISRSIEQEDTAALRSALAEGPVDFTARSKRGRTVLGRAVEHAADHESTPVALESVRMLLAAGAKPLPNVIEPEPDQGDLDAHLLVAYVFGANNPNAVPLLDMLLGAGANANTRNYEGEPLYFLLDATLPKLEVLAKHGADFTVGDTRSDRAEWTAAMVAAQLGRWDHVLFLLDHGVPADRVAPDSTTLRSIIETKKREGVADSVLAPIVQRLGRNR